MQITGLLHGSRLLKHVGFPCSEVLGPGASEDDIQAFIEEHGLVFVKPIFKGAIGKKGMAGLVGMVRDLQSALAEKERLYFAEHRHGNVTAKANKALQHQATSQCIGVSATSAGSHHQDGTETSDALTIKPDQSDQAPQRSKGAGAVAKEFCFSISRVSKSPLGPHLTSSCAAQRSSLHP